MNQVQVQWGKNEIFTLKPHYIIAGDWCLLFNQLKDIISLQILIFNYVCELHKTH